MAATSAVRADDLWKRFGDREVVRGVSFSLGPGQVLGLVGPNGAGKTTIIRMLLGIVEPDRGEVTIRGKRLGNDTRERIGYLPEERGLYKGQRILETLVYLGELRGLARHDAARRAEDLLTRLGMTPHRTKKIGELSRGQAQLIQFAASVIHRPSVVVLDEPFAGLDPVYVRLIKEFIVEMHGNGAALILSTHHMDQVEDLCDHVVMLDEGTVVLRGSLTEVKRRYRGDTLAVTCQPWPDAIIGVRDVRRNGDGYVMHMLPGTTPNLVLSQLMERGSAIERFEVETPSMEEIFLTVVGVRDE